MLLTAFAVPVGLAPAAARAGEAAWVSGAHSEVRLNPLAAAPDGSGYRLSLDIRLEDGFKTYWRTPGDSGVPPQFDWAQSVNLGSVAVRWPAPERFFDGAGFANGYSDEVRFPLTVVPREPGNPLTLSLELDYAVCREVCIPTKTRVSVHLPADLGTPATEDAIAAVEAEVPVRVALGEAADGLSIGKVEVGADKGRPVVLVSARLPAEAAEAELFAEGPEGWFFGKPDIVSKDGETVNFRVPVEERPKESASAKVPLLLTLVGENRAIEVSVDLDAGSVPR